MSGISWYYFVIFAEGSGNKHLPEFPLCVRHSVRCVLLIFSSISYPANNPNKYVPLCLCCNWENRLRDVKSLAQIYTVSEQKQNKNENQKQLHLSLKSMLPQRYEVLSLILNLSKVTELGEWNFWLSLDVLSTTFCLCSVVLVCFIILSSAKVQKTGQRFAFYETFQIHVIKQPWILLVARLNTVLANPLAFTHRSCFEPLI